jgi:hypothetical protein
MQDLNVPSNRSFGITFSIFFLVVAFFPLLSGGSTFYWAIAVSAGFLIAALLVPAILSIPNRIWTMLGYLLSRLTNPLALGILFFIFITPFAIILRLFGKDFLKLGFDKKVESYWLPGKNRFPVEQSMKNQF